MNRILPLHSLHVEFQFLRHQRPSESLVHSSSLPLQLAPTLEDSCPVSFVSGSVQYKFCGEFLLTQLLSSGAECTLLFNKYFFQWFSVAPPFLMLNPLCVWLKNSWIICEAWQQSIYNASDVIYVLLTLTSFIDAIVIWWWCFLISKSILHLASMC